MDRKPPRGWASTTPKATPGCRRGSWPEMPRAGRVTDWAGPRSRGFADGSGHGVLDDGSPQPGHRRAFTKESVHGFDLTFAGPKSVSLVRP